MAIFFFPHYFACKNRSRNALDRHFSDAARSRHAYSESLAGVGSESVLFESGVIYSARGTRFTESYLFFVTQRSLKLHYIDMPMMVVVAPDKFRFFLGPQFSILQSAKLDYDKTDYDDYFANTSWSLRFGAGFTVSRFTSQLTFINGLTDIAKDPNVKWRSNALEFSIGLVLMSKNKFMADKEKKESIIPNHRKID